MTGHCFKQVTEVVDDETKTRFLYSPMLIDSNVNAAQTAVNNSGKPVVHTIHCNAPQEALLLQGNRAMLHKALLLVNTNATLQI